MSRRFQVLFFIAQIKNCHISISGLDLVIYNVRHMLYSTLG